MIKRLTKKQIVRICFAFVAIILVIWTAWGNTAVEVNKVIVYFNDLPEAFNGYRIAHISDLHNARFGKNNEDILELLKSASPDMIAITGDMIDSDKTDVGVAVRFVTEAVKIAPCFYVTGNHEAWVNKSVYAELEEKMKAAGVTVLHDSAFSVEKDGTYVSLIGMDDTEYAARNSVMNSIDERLGTLSSTESFTVLLSHRPELFEEYCEAGIDLVLSGHAHGGQFRLPIIGGIAAPDQGLFPKYDAGRFSDGNTTMIVSRGIGNSIIPIRFNNRPEIVLIELRVNSDDS